MFTKIDNNALLKDVQKLCKKNSANLEKCVEIINQKGDTYVTHEDRYLKVFNKFKENIFKIYDVIERKFGKLRVLKNIEKLKSFFSKTDKQKSNPVRKDEVLNVLSVTSNFYDKFYALFADSINNPDPRLLEIKTRLQSAIVNIDTFSDLEQWNDRLVTKFKPCYDDFVKVINSINLKDMLEADDVELRDCVLQIEIFFERFLHLMPEYFPKKENIKSKIEKIVRISTRIKRRPRHSLYSIARFIKYIAEFIGYLIPIIDGYKKNKKLYEEKMNLYGELIEINKNLKKTFKQITPLSTISTFIKILNHNKFGELRNLVRIKRKLDEYIKNEIGTEKEKKEIRKLSEDCEGVLNIARRLLSEQRNNLITFLKELNIDLNKKDREIIEQLQNLKSKDSKKFIKYAEKLIKDFNSFQRTTQKLSKSIKNLINHTTS